MEQYGEQHNHERDYAADLQTASKLFDAYNDMLARNGVNHMDTPIEKRHYELNLDGYTLERAQQFFAENCFDVPNTVEIHLYGTNPNIHNTTERGGIQLQMSHEDTEAKYSTLYTAWFTGIGEHEVHLSKDLHYTTKLQGPRPDIGLMPTTGEMHGMMYEDAPITPFEREFLLKLAREL